MGSSYSTDRRIGIYGASLELIGVGWFVAFLIFARPASCKELPCDKGCQARDWLTFAENASRSMFCEIMALQSLMSGLAVRAYSIILSVWYPGDHRILRDPEMVRNCLSKYVTGCRSYYCVWCCCWSCFLCEIYELARPSAGLM